LVTCHVRYTLNLDALDAFIEYGRIWTALITKLGGTHHGFFLPLGSEGRNMGAISFPGVGAEGPANVAVAMYSFPDWESYQRYRAEAGKDPECEHATAIANASKCFTSYESMFLTPLPTSLQSTSERRNFGTPSYPGGSQAVGS
jgi:hypothetical protein